MAPEDPNRQAQETSLFNYQRWSALAGSIGGISCCLIILGVSIPCLVILVGALFSK